MDIFNNIIPTNSETQTNNNIHYEFNNDITCNQNQSVIVDMPTQVNIKIHSNPGKLNVNIPTKLNINILVNPKKEAGTYKPNIIIHTNSTTKSVKTYLMNPILTYLVIKMYQSMST